VHEEVAVFRWNKKGCDSRFSACPNHVIGDKIRPVDMENKSEAPIVSLSNASMFFARVEVTETSEPHTNIGSILLDTLSITFTLRLSVILAVIYQPWLLLLSASCHGRIFDRYRCGKLKQTFQA